MGLERILHTRFGQILLSIILGFGLASLFRKACKDRNCLVFKAPNHNEIDKKIYNFDGECYQFKPKVKRCDVTKNILEFN